MKPNNRESRHCIASITEAFLSSSLGAPLFILDPSQDLEVVFTNPPARRYFDLSDDPSCHWFIEKWPEGISAQWRQAFVEQVRREQKSYQLIPEAIQKIKASSQEMCFIWFDAQGTSFIAAVILNSDTHVLGNFEPKAIQNALELGDFYHSILDSLHDSIGLFEFDDQNSLRVVWLNERAMRYVSPRTSVEGELVSCLLFDSIKSSWLGLENTLINSTESVSCSFMLGREASDNVFEIYFYPVQLLNKSKRKQFIATWYNVTKLYQKERAETQQRQDFYNLVENSPDVIVRYDVSGRRTYVNRSFELSTGLTRDKAIGKRPLEYAGIGASAAKIQNNVLKAVTTGMPVTERVLIDVKGRDNVIHEIRCIPEFDKQGTTTGVLLVARDFTDQELAIQQTENSELKFRTLVENSPDFISRYDLNCQLLYGNPAHTKLFACPIEQMLGQTPTQLITYLHQRFGHSAPENVSILEDTIKEVICTKLSGECEISSPTALGQVFSYVSITPEFNLEGELSSVLVVGRDLTELKAFQEKVNYLSKHDPLTGLPNRVDLLEKVSSQLRQTSSSSYKFGLLVIGVDHFKSINDSFGYEYGDSVLKALALRLQTVVPKSSYLARIGADEFGILVAQVIDRIGFSFEAARIREALSLPIRVNGQEIVVSVSIGACIYPDDAQEIEDLVRYADSALFAAKSSQRGSICFYSNELTERAVERMEIRNSLRSALKNREFCVYLQPKICLNDGKMMGAEALVRWHHPTRGLLMPDLFIPIAEELNLISEIDMQVLDELCRYLHVWQAKLLPEQGFAVNLSALQFYREDLLSTIQEVMQRRQCIPDNLELEITEGVLLVHCEHLSQKIHHLKHLGFTLVLDDFGTGYSSLSYLSRYPIDVLKIDRSFIRDMNHSSASQVLVKTIVSMAQNLNMKVVAEGVEETKQAELLSSYGVKLAQGFLYSRPIPIAQFAQQYDLPTPN